MSIGKFVSIGSMALFIAGCSNHSPVSVDRSGENPGVTAIGSNTYIASVPISNPGSNCAMTRSEYFPGNLEMIRNAANLTLEHLWWSPGMSAWVSTGTFGSNANSSPAACALLSDKNLHVVAQDASNGTLRHYWRAGDGSGSWNYTGAFSYGCAGSPAMICNRQIPTNLEVVVRTNNNYLKHMYRGSNQAWEETGIFATGQYVVGDPEMVQTTDGNLHVIATIRDFKLSTIFGYWRRTLVNNTYTWQYMGKFGKRSPPAPSSGYALMVNRSNNSIEACVLENYSDPFGGYNDYTFYKNTSQSQFVLDGRLGVSNPVNLGAVPDNPGNEFHVAFEIAGSGTTGYHSKVMQ
jgi:hypothetical protein